MKTIKPGKVIDEIGMRVTCRNCNGVFEIEKKGEAKYTSDQRDGSFYSVACPTSRCGATITFTEHDITRRSTAS
jgi:hypothetical protein